MVDICQLLGQIPLYHDDDPNIHQALSFCHLPDAILPFFACLLESSDLFCVHPTLLMRESSLREYGKLDQVVQPRTREDRI